MEYIKSLMDEPHEKIYINFILIIILSFVYYILYLYDNESFIINEELLKRNRGKLDYFDFLYFSILNQLTVSYGDLIPLTNIIKLIVSLQILLFWGIALI